MLAVWTTCKNNNNNNIDNTHYCTKKKNNGQYIGPNIILSQKKNTHWKQGEFYKKGAFPPPDGVMCLYMRLKPGHKTRDSKTTQAERAVWNCIEAEKSFPTLRTKGWGGEIIRRVRMNVRVLPSQTSHSQIACTVWSPYNVKSCVIIIMENTTNYMKISLNLNLFTIP